MRTRLAAAVLVLLATASLAGCTASGSGAASGSGSATVATKDRSVVTTGTLSLVSDRPIRAARRIEALAAAAGGSVASSRQEPGDRASASLTLRIPATRFSSTLAAIQREGEVRDLRTEATDVTATVTDTATRIANLRTSIARLQQLLTAATSSSALVEIESALTDRQGSLESLLAEQRTLADQVTAATLRVEVVVPAAAPSGPSDFLSGVAAGWLALVGFGVALAVGAGVLLPWIVPVALLGAAGWLVARRVRRRPAAA